MKWVMVALDAVPAVAWRNGGGVTRELLAWPSTQDWKVRISVADIDRDGPFSRFEGVERGFTVLEGQGVLLRFAGGEHRLVPGDEPLRFAGTDAVDCRLIGGPTRDFNLMAPPGRGTLNRTSGEARRGCQAGSLVALYTHATPARLACDAEVRDLSAGQLAWSVLDADTTIKIQAEDALWMEVRA